MAKVPWLTRVVTVGWSAAAGNGWADEGMWPFDRVPISEISAKHRVRLTDAWIERVMRSTVRIGQGSGALVSEDGLVLTNHHVASECIQALSSPGPDRMAGGFVAASQAEELRCDGLEALALVSIEDVSTAIASAPVRTAAIGSAEKRCAEETGLHCEVVPLFAGALHHLYRYRRFTDVRLAFAPEIDVAFFGGDADNFGYPRYCLDAALLRAYANGKPAAIGEYLAVSKVRPKEGDTIFISGNPRSTDRYVPVAKLVLLETLAYPFLLERLRSERDALERYSARGPAEEKAARDELFDRRNSIKAISGYLDGLQDDALLDAARKREARIIGRVRGLADRALEARLLEAWPKLEAAYAQHATFYREHAVLERWFAPSGRLPAAARHILRASEERSKVDGQRLRDYRESNLDVVRSSVVSAAPVDVGLEIELLAIGIENIVSVLGRDAPLVRALLDGKSPRDRAAAVVSGTKLADVEVRRSLFDGRTLGKGVDPMIALVRTYDARARVLQALYEERVEAVEREHLGKIAQAYSAAFGATVYPDATFTPRLGVGRIAGYHEGPTAVPWHTTFAGMFARSDAAKNGAPDRLPARWLAARTSLDLATPFDLATTADIISGSSGSPLIGADGKVVGVIFDQNVHQLPNRFLYREEQGRSIAASSEALLAALTKVYSAGHLAAELTR
jgi:hypothetical protein